VIRKQQAVDLNGDAIIPSSTYTAWTSFATEDAVVARGERLCGSDPTVQNAGHCFIRGDVAGPSAPLRADRARRRKPQGPRCALNLQSWALGLDRPRS
jgi:hypothetical protein